MNHVWPARSFDRSWGFA